MSNRTDAKITADQWNDQVSALKDAAASSTDACLVSKFIAASDARVQEVFFRKVAAGHIFQGVSCIDRVSIPENRYVVFDFQCQPGTLCFIPPAFMVIVNFIDRYVVAIVDPYIPVSDVCQSRTSCGCGGSQARSPKSRMKRASCPQVTIEDGQACLRIPYAGDVCVSVPDWIPNGTIAEACIDTCSEFGLLCGAKVTVRVAGQQVACESWGCCDC